MDISDKFKKLWYHPSSFWIRLEMMELLNWVPYEIYLKIAYRLEMKKKLNLINPQTYNEKLQWLKLYSRKPEYTQLVDKYEVRQYIENTIGAEYLIPLLGLYDTFDDIDFEALPDTFVLKCTHDSGSVIICRDKNTFDINKAKKDLTLSLKHNYFYGGREYPYINIKPRIIAEKYMVDESGYELKDYKFFAFDGEVKALFIATDRQSGETKFDYFDAEFNHLPFLQGHPNALKKLKKPLSFDKMKELASKLSKGMPEVRIDFYDINGHIYFGEITFFHYSGYTPFEPEDWDYTFGSWINLEKN